MFNSCSLSLCRESLTTQLEESLTRADTEKLARSVVEEQFSSLEKEKIMKELEIKDMMARHKQELGEKEATISSVRSGVCFIQGRKCFQFYLMFL